MVLFATYLYTKPERGSGGGGAVLPAPVHIANLEKASAERPGSSNGYDDAFGGVLKSPLRADGMASSRPGTPTKGRFGKRDA